MGKLIYQASTIEIMSIMDEKSPAPIGIPTGVYMWLPCKKMHQNNKTHYFKS